MAIRKLDVNKSIDVVISVEDKPLAGQTGATLVQNTVAIDITNQINPDWSKSLPGTRSWRVNCGGLYVVNASSLSILQQAFMNNTPLQVSFTVAGRTYTGEAILTDFPLQSTFSKGLTYSAVLLGTGELQ